MTESGTLAGTVALVTGASSGIGASVRWVTSASMATAVPPPASRMSPARLASRSERRATTATVAPKLARRRAVAAFAAVPRAVDELGRLDVVVNNAGVMLLGPILEAPTEEWERMVQVNVSSVAGRQVRLGSGVYNATKHAVGAFSESLRQEVTSQHVRVSLIEPGAVATELAGHNRPEIRAGMAERFAHMTRLEADDIADAVAYIVTRPRHVAVNEILIRPTDQQQ